MADFPYEYKSHPRKQGTLCNTRDELLDCILKQYGKTASENMWKGLRVCRFPATLIYDEDTVRNIRRYDYCQRFGTVPYPGAFDDQPAEWIDFCDIYTTELGQMRG